MNDSTVLNARSVAKRERDIGHQEVAAIIEGLAAKIERLKTENTDLRRWKALDKPITAAMRIVQADMERLTDELERLHEHKDAMRLEAIQQQLEIKRLNAALDEIIALDHYPDATIARKARGMPTTDRERDDD